MEALAWLHLSVLALLVSSVVTKLLVLLGQGWMVMLPPSWDHQRC